MPASYMFKRSDFGWPFENKTHPFLFSLFWGTDQVDVSRLQIVIAGYIYNYVHVITQRLISAMEHLIRA
jgi:hypothetical protein